MVYVHVRQDENPQEWVDAIVEKLPPVGQGEGRLEFQVRPFLGPGLLESGVPAVILKQLTALLNYHGEQAVIVVEDEGWHPGVIGIVANRLMHRFHRPAIVIALQ